MTTHLNDEAVWVKKAQAGCVEAFGVLADFYERRIYRLARAITMNPADAEDVLQETFLKAYSRLRFFGGESRFHTWLIRIAVDEALTRLRRRNLPGLVSLDERIDLGSAALMMRDAEDVRDYSPAESFSSTELGFILSKVLETLSSSLRVVFVLRDVEGLTSEETAFVLGSSVEIIRARLLRARLELRPFLSQKLQESSAVEAN